MIDNRFRWAQGLTIKLIGVAVVVLSLILVGAALYFGWA